MKGEQGRKKNKLRRGIKVERLEERRKKRRGDKKMRKTMKKEG